MINEIVAACDVDLAQSLPASLDGVDRPATATRARARWRGSSPDSRAARVRRELHARCTPRRRSVAASDAGRHRHRRRGQELAHRRAGAALPPRPAATALRIAILSVDPSRRKSGGALLGDRIRMNAIDASEHLHALARDARRRQRDQPRAAGRDRGLQGGGLRPRHRRDVRHRPGRRGDRAARRRVALRDDARVRRRDAAREDRHARLRRLRRDQQVRPQGRAGRAARRAQAVPAQPRALPRGAGRDAGVRHDGVALQRRRRDRAVPGAVANAGRARA